MFAHLTTWELATYGQVLGPCQARAKAQKRETVFLEHFQFEGFQNVVSEGPSSQS